MTLMQLLIYYANPSEVSGENDAGSSMQKGALEDFSVATALPPATCWNAHGHQFHRKRCDDASAANRSLPN